VPLSCTFATASLRRERETMALEQMYFTFKTAAELCDVSQDVPKAAVRAGQLRI
jgi:hypothetical protein